MFYCVLPCITGFYRVLPGFTGFYRVLPGFTGFYRVLSGFTGFYRVLPGFTGFYRVLPGFTGFYRVLPGFIGFYRVPLDCVIDFRAHLSVQFAEGGDSVGAEAKPVLHDVGVAADAVVLVGAEQVAAVVVPLRHLPHSLVLLVLRYETVQIWRRTVPI